MQARLLGETRADGVVRLTLNRPERRNALSAALAAELTDALERIDGEAASESRVVVLGAAGADFCAGADLHELAASADMPLGEQRDDALRLARLFLRMRTLRVPIIAAVQGRALAGGCGLATACDLVLASEAARFGYPEVGIGFVPAMVMASLRRSVGEKRAFELVATGRIIDAAEAERIGLVNRVFPASHLEAEVDACARAMAARSATALHLSRRLLYAQEGMDFEAAVRAGVDVNVLARRSSDARAGIRDFVNQRLDSR